MGGREGEVRWQVEWGRQWLRHQQAAVRHCIVGGGCRLGFRCRISKAQTGKEARRGQKRLDTYLCPAHPERAPASQPGTLQLSAGQQAHTQLAPAQQPVREHWRAAAAALLPLRPGLPFWHRGAPAVQQQGEGLPLWAPRLLRRRRVPRAPLVPRPAPPAAPPLRAARACGAAHGLISHSVARCSQSLPNVMGSARTRRRAPCSHNAQEFTGEQRSQAGAGATQLVMATTLWLLEQPQAVARTNAGKVLCHRFKGRAPGHSAVGAHVLSLPGHSIPAAGRGSGGDRGGQGQASGNAQSDVSQA